MQLRACEEAQGIGSGAGKLFVLDGAYLNKPLSKSDETLRSQHEMHDEPGALDVYDHVSAFTVAELGEILPDEMEISEQTYWLNICRGLNNQWDVAYRKNGTAFTAFVHQADTEADARAKMLVYLLENKLMTLPAAS